jgi:hypothetical protein
MNGSTRFGWKATSAMALVAAVAVGGAIAWGQPAPSTPATPPAGTRPAGPAAPTPAAGNRDQAIEAFQKARDLYNKERYAEAATENDRALKLDPKLDQALLLRDLIKRKMAEGPGGPTGPGDATTTGPAPAADKVQLLKQSDIAILRVREWSSDADANLKGKIARDTLSKFWTDVVKKKEPTATKEQENKFLAPTNFAEQVSRIREAGDTSYMEKVEFHGDPAALATYKRTVQRFVLENCATAQCHAGDKAGNFRLIRPANANGVNDQTTYTNFYILAMYSNKDGKMIDRDSPEKSLLLQYGTVKKNATAAHPGKPEVRYFTDKSDARFVAMTEWMKTLAFPRPNYGIVYELPGAAAAVTPAVVPATAPAPTTRTGPATRPVTPPKTGPVPPGK